MGEVDVGYPCHHKWKVIRAEEGKEETLFSKLFGFARLDNIIIYHLACEKCGNLRIVTLPICDRSQPVKILKETKWQR